MAEADPASKENSGPGGNTAGSGGSISRIPPEVCRTMLMNSAVGRLAFVDSDGRQQLMPVNFATVEDDIYFRTSAGGPLSVLASGRDGIAFGVDEYDVSSGRGWNVTVRGTTSRVNDESTIDRVAAVGLHRSWAGSDRTLLIRLRIREIDGRRVARY